MGEEVTIRPFTERDAAQVRQLFITVNRLLSPPTSATPLRRISSVH